MYGPHYIGSQNTDPDCVPSYGLQTGAKYAIGKSAVQTNAENFLARGIPVSTTDFEGLTAAYTSGPQAAYAVLDGIRAVVQSGNITGMKSTGQTAMFGYSGGCIAVEWAAELTSSYANDLYIVGAACGGLPVNSTSGKLATSGTSNAGLAFASTNGLAAAYPAFATCLEKALVPDKAAAFHNARTTCYPASMYTNQDFFSYFIMGKAFLSTSCWLDVVNTAAIMGLHANGGPKKFPLVFPLVAVCRISKANSCL